MQRVTILCVGKLKEKFYIDAAAEYVKRLQRYCKLDVVELPEYRLPEEPSPAEIQKALQAEGAAIRERLPKGGAVVALCIEGKPCSSEELSRRMADFGVQGKTQITFLIGGSVGLVLGKLLHWFVMEQINIDMVSFPHTVMPLSYGYSLLLTFLFAFIVNLVMFQKLDKINMAESLKSIE